MHSRLKFDRILSASSACWMRVLVQSSAVCAALQLAPDRFTSVFWQLVQLQQMEIGKLRMPPFSTPVSKFVVQQG